MKVNIIYPGDSWILNNFGTELVKRIPGAASNATDRDNYDINYYINYAMYKGPSKGKDVAWFTHIEENNPALITKWMDVVNDIDCCVCMSKKYQDKIEGSYLIHPGIDDMYLQPKKLKLGIIAKLSNSHRKGQELINKVRALPFVELKITDGCIQDKDMPAFYESVDYILVTSRYEGGPMSVLEGRAMNKDIIIKEGVGYEQEFYSYTYLNDDDLIRLLQEIYENKNQLRESVAEFTWDYCAKKHIELFESLIK